MRGERVRKEWGKRAESPEILVKSISAIERKMKFLKKIRANEKG